MKKLIIFLFISLFLINMVGAETFPQSQAVQLIKSCTNSSGSICSNSATCNVTVKAPFNNSILVDNKLMTNNQNGLFNYTLSSSINSVRGSYNWDMFCCDSIDCGEAHGNYKVTTNGEETSPQKAGISIAMIVLMIFLFIFSLFVWSRLPSRNEYDESTGGLNTNNLKFFRPVLLMLSYCILIGIVFISSNTSYLFLDNSLIAGFLFRLSLMMMYAIVPLIVILFLVNLYKFVMDNKIKENMKRGGIDFGGDQL